ncbi:hypothetical protein [Corallincola spongiicola]|uniref:Uncharacterized protein n=1 Tax=Corallincola spongiicola TaxID=2520508 RepID=A0ABY1WU64_9GAMM|nr:hypothetical protein [Corallincola spongiicola]TAA48294.1 hypothetical protein EXY25_03415 [Corallincola spongiicola]
MYRRTNKYQKNIEQSYSKRAAQESEPSQDYEKPKQLPKLRRVIEITDFDAGEAIVHRIELFKTDRIDCYDVVIDGKLWQRRMGWSRILASIRKAMPRLTGELYP